MTMRARARPLKRDFRFLASRGVGPCVFPEQCQEFLWRTELTSMSVWFIFMTLWHPAWVGALGCCPVSIPLIGVQCALTTCWETLLQQWSFHISFNKWCCGLTGRVVLIHTLESFKCLLRTRLFLTKTLSM